MFRNYFKLAVRHLNRNRLFSTINVVGLSVGIALTLLIAAYCWSEWRVNKTLKHANRQYILTSSSKTAGTAMSITNLGPLARALRENYPNLVAGYYRFDAITSTVSYGDKHFREVIQIGDSSWLTMYGFPLLQGDASTALNQPFTVVITADKAMKYFGSTDVVGKSLTIENFSGDKQDFRVTGVLQEPGRNSVTWINEGNNNRLFVPTSNLAFFGRKMDWATVYIVNYVELQKGVRPETLAGPIQRLVKANAPPAIAADIQVDVLPLSSFYFSGNGGTVEKMVYTLSFIALFILLMAIINFVNLSVRQSTARMREIGIRKVLGSLHRQLIMQFLTESVLLVLIATAFSLVLYTICMPLVADMLGKQIPSLAALPAFTWLVIPLFALFTGGVAGLYPAFRLSSLASVDSLKGKVSMAGERVLLRKGLVAFQFTTAIVVLVGAMIISQQISLFFSDRLGYDKEYVVAAQPPRDWSRKGVQRMETLRTEFARMPGIKDVTLSYEIPNGMNGGSSGVFREGGDSSRAVMTQLLVSDAHYADTYRIPLQAGVFFHGPADSDVQDSLRMVINETAAKALGWQDAQKAVGQRVRMFGDPQLYTVCGVVKDFHFDGMGVAISPSAFVAVSRFNTYRYFSFKLRPGNIGTTMAALRRQWSILMPDAAFEYKFMDETLQLVYTDELRLRKAANASTVLALVIVLLGVAGLLASSIQRRTKEIAIRKVIGASVPGIIRLFLREYLPLLGIAGLVATPPAYLLMRYWLEGYATRITITPWPFVVAILSLGMVMMILITLQTMKAALANPVSSLKTE